MKKGWWGFWGYVLGSLESDQAAERAYEQGLRDASQIDPSVYTEVEPKERRTENIFGLLFVLFISITAVTFFLWFDKLPDNWIASGKISLLIALNISAWITLGGLLRCIISLIKKQHIDWKLLLFGFAASGFTGTCLLSFTKYFSYLPHDWDVFPIVATILAINLFGWYALAGVVICLVNIMRRQKLDFKFLIFGSMGIGLTASTILSFEKYYYNLPEHWWIIAKIAVMLGLNLLCWSVFGYILYSLSSKMKVTRKTNRKPSELDDLFNDAVTLAIETGTCSVSFIQHELNIGYDRAYRLIDMMIMAGILGEYKDSQDCKVTMTATEYENAKKQMIIGDIADYADLLARRQRI